MTKRDQSGASDKQLRISKAGDAYLRRLSSSLCFNGFTRSSISRFETTSCPGGCVMMWPPPQRITNGSNNSAIDLNHIRVGYHSTGLDASSPPTLKVKKQRIRPPAQDPKNRFKKKCGISHQCRLGSAYRRENYKMDPHTFRQNKVQRNTRAPFAKCGAFISVAAILQAGVASGQDFAITTVRKTENRTLEIEIPLAADRYAILYRSFGLDGSGRRAIALVRGTGSSVTMRDTAPFSAQGFLHVEQFDNALPGDAGW